MVDLRVQPIPCHERTPAGPAGRVVFLCRLYRPPGVLVTRLGNTSGYGWPEQGCLLTIGNELRMTSLVCWMTDDQPKNGS